MKLIKAGLITVRIKEDGVVIITIENTDPKRYPWEESFEYEVTADELILDATDVEGGGPTRLDLKELRDGRS